MNSGTDIVSAAAKATCPRYANVVPGARHQFGVPGHAADCLPVEQQAEARSLGLKSSCTFYWT